MSQSSVLHGLYELVQSASNSGDLFEDLCVEFLRSMGFRNVRRRRGTELGRDIDAEFADMRWFFECKLVHKDVDTASFAYKFLQLDTLAPAQKPDFFILLSNGSIKSILNDIVRFKQVDQNTTYEVAIWGNHDSECVFDDIILSEIETVLAFIQNRFPGAFSETNRDVLLRAGQAHRESRSRFVERLTLMPVFRRRAGDGSDSALVRFAHDALVAAILNCLPAQLNLYPLLTVIGVPDAPWFGLFPCSSVGARQELSSKFKDWAMYANDDQVPSSMLFDEATFGPRVKTIFSEWGALATFQEIEFGPIVQVEELFGPIKEAAVRFRNYLKRGTLITPCRIYVRIDGSNAGITLKLGKTATASKVRFRNFEEGYLTEWGLDERPNDLLRDAPVCAEPIRIFNPPNHYRELGLGLAESCWSAIFRNSEPLLSAIQRIDERLKKPDNTIDAVSQLQRYENFRHSFDYILDHDRFERPYSKFEPRQMIT